jgi:serine/threonine protein kinase
LKEAMSLHKLDHDHIIRLENAFRIGKELVLLTEYIEGGELTDYILEHEG